MKDNWVKTTDMMPLESDANNVGEVYVDNGVGYSQLFHWNHLIISDGWSWMKAPNRPKPKIIK